MDILFILLIVVIVIIFVLMLLYGTSEKSYEQALEEQRSKNDDLLSTSNLKGENVKKDGKKDKDKSRKLKESVIKKHKEKTLAYQQPTNKNLIQKQEKNVEKNVTPKEVVEPILKQTIPEIQSIEVIDAPVKQVEKPVKSQNIKKIHNIEPKIVPVAEIIEKDTPNSGANQIIEQIFKPELKTNNNKKNKKSLIVTSKAPKELRFSDIMEFIRLSVLSDEEVAILTDALLNEQADDKVNDNWHKKNDPLETLKKQVIEKEELIERQSKNLEAAKRKSEDLLMSFQNLKKFNTKLELEIDFLKKECENQKMHFDATLKDIELKNQQKCDHLLVEIKNEERNRMLLDNKINQEDVARLNAMISKQNDRLQEKEKDLNNLIELNKKLDERNKMVENEIKEHDEKYVSLEEKRRIEFGNLQEKINNLLIEKSALESKLKESSTANADTEKYKIEIQSIESKLKEYISTNEELVTNVANQKNENAILSNSNQSFQNEINILKSDIDQLKVENNTLSLQLKALADEKNNLSSKSDDLNNLILKHDHQLENFRIVCDKLNLPADSENLLKKVDDLKIKLHKYDEFTSKYSDLNDLYNQVIKEKENLKDQFETLKKEFKDENTKSRDYASTLLETEKILNELQEKIVKEKNDQKQKLEEFELILTEKSDEVDNLKYDLQKYRENVINLTEINDSLNTRISDLKELVSNTENEISSAKAQGQEVSEELENMKSENKNLKSKIVKLNDLVQIGNHSYQEENKKVQDLECKISLLNGSENSSLSSTINGNSANNLLQH